jgi:hypothetical protein
MESNATTMFMPKKIYEDALLANDGDALKAASGIVHTMSMYPNTRTNDAIEAVAALLREAMLKRGSR